MTPRLQPTINTKKEIKNLEDEKSELFKKKDKADIGKIKAVDEASRLHQETMRLKSEIRPLETRAEMHGPRCLLVCASRSVYSSLPQVT